ncbi:TonB-dependent receptor [Roseivirga sp. E12]|uniref:TonB-dependent receptor n=1 Tax=Roseivirga sp. E12 TaxID=2819237 RepID=UPI001ABD20B0|nr:TonB-dependent receptor [Roseivirga sp. E12]MBO3699890.1 TonB-dependent receptor [Roseivirga sp. E12]
MNSHLRKLTISLVFLALAGTSILAQNSATIRGKVKGKDGVAIPYASVILENTPLGKATNENGSFKLAGVKPGEYILKISSVGFITIRQNIKVDAGDLLTLSFEFEESVYEVPQLTIIASRDQLFTKIPGSADYLSQAELKLLSPISGNEAFRRVSGVHVVEEEGLGLRANIGIRGLDPDRSRNVLVLEDGIPVALNPYGEPDAYYTPSIDRMAGVEVLKGSGQILYGPRTIGGVVNYITANPSEDETVSLKLRGGQNGYFSGLLGYGNTFGNTGVQFNLLRKQADGLGVSTFDINDFTGKINFRMSDRSQLGLKFGLYRETSNSTYVGITQVMYDQGGNDFTNVAPDDRLNVNRNSISLTHNYRINDRLNLQTMAYAYSTTRNWRRQDFSYSPTASNLSGVVWGDTSIPGGAIYMRNGTGNRNRQFEVAGFEQRINLEYNLGSINNELTAGYRYIYEKGYEQRVNGSFPTSDSGDLITDEDRTGNAISAFVQNKFKLSSKFSIDAGLRAEFYDFERHVFRNKFGGEVRDTSIVNGSSVSEIIPGLGFNYQLNRDINLFGGIHRGFAPPRVKDAITSAGVVQQLDAELSWNYELGLRTSLTKGLYAEVTGFYLDFSNQIIPVSESAGGTGSGLINGGETTHEGIEVGLSFDLSEIRDVQYNVLLDVTATFQNATFAADRFQNIGTESVNLSGNQTPYAPQTLLSSALTIASPFGLTARVTNTFVGEQFTDPLNTVVPSANGRIGKLDSYFLTDLQLIYDFPKVENLSINLSIKNLSNERYISSRRPQGIRVGLTRFTSLGIDWTL